MRGLDGEVAYMLGVFDGEGCISTCRNGGGRGAPGVHVQITMASQDVAELFAAHWGGSAKPRSSVTAGGLTLWVWRITGHRARWFLQLLAAHSLTKRKQADLALQMLSLTMSGPRGSRTLAPANATERERLAGEIRKLNGARSRFAA